jgi:hypothetical protein
MASQLHDDVLICIREVRSGRKQFHQFIEDGNRRLSVGADEKRDADKEAEWVVAKLLLQEAE